jgi:hypothetical protein
MTDQGPNLALVIALFLAVFPTLWCLVVLLLSVVGGWRRLGAAYAATSLPHGTEFHWQTGGVGVVSYRNCLSVHVAPEGLFLSLPWMFRIGHRTLLIPWQEIHSRTPVRFLWRRSVRFQVGAPPVASILLPQHVIDAAEPAA